jgi:membrane-associated protease RseP (regulator of RpoE activity)
MNSRLKTLLVHSGLFLLTFVTTTLAGAEWVYSKSILVPGYTWADFASGLPYSVPFLLILTAHEFGHYFTALFYRVKTTLPYYIPLPPLPLMLGTLGAIIRIKSHIYSKKQNFDIGIAGPLAGFVVALGILIYGYTHLPPADYVFQFHPEYQAYGPNYADHVYGPDHLPPGTVDVVIGKNLLMWMLENWVADPARVPNAHELIHYPILFAGFLSLVFTSLNLLPIGQLDGGHVLYGLLGFRRHRLVASVVFVLFLGYAGLGLLRPGEQMMLFDMQLPHVISVALVIGFYYLCLGGLLLGWRDTLMYAVMVFAVQYLLVWMFPGWHGYPGWLLFTFILGRFIRVPHPPSEIEEPLSLGRKILGWLALLIFILCFVPNPIELITTEVQMPVEGANV